MVHRLWMRHAAGLYASTKAAIARTASNLGSNLFRFLPSALPLTPSTNNDNDMSVTSENGVPADAPFIVQLNNGSSRVWRTPIFCPKQEQAVRTILFSEECGGKLIIIDRTWSGKSHTICMFALFVGGIALVIVPLLLLTANQITKTGWLYKLRVL